MSVRGNTLAAWIEPRLEGAPPELAEAVRMLIGEVRAAEAGEGAEVPDVLAGAALTGLDGVLADAAPPREAALRLLAADASLTYAFEAAASLGTDVEALALRIGPGGELGRRLGEGSPASGEMP